MSKKKIEHLRGDPVLSEIIATTKLKSLPTNRDVYATLVRTIVFQQLSGKAANTIHQRLLTLFEDSYPVPTELVKIKLQRLRDVGLSQQKGNYVQNVAQHWIDNQLEAIDWRKQTDEQIIERLTQIKGVGVWSVQMILMFTLNRPDVFPISDLGIRNAMAKAYRLRSKDRALDKRLTRISTAWQPYRTLACRYLWCWVDG